VTLQVRIEPVVQRRDVGADAEALPIESFGRGKRCEIGAHLSTWFTSRAWRLDCVPRGQMQGMPVVTSLS